jgi:energy-coupling factor transporter transmembrane protein EcfT
MSNPNVNLLDKLLEKVLQISKVSYGQEVDRSKQLLAKSDYLIKYLSTIFVFVNIFLPLAFKYNIINLKVLAFIYFAISVPLIFSLFLSIKSQRLRLGMFFPTGKYLLEEMKRNQDKFNTEIKMKNKSILYYSTSTETLQKTNDERAKNLKAAYTSYFSSIIILAVAIFSIMIIVA